MINLTRRQRDALAKLQELYRETGHAVHYTDLAQRLGINRFSAYDMLKVLERKGAVGSEYILSTVTGPGRPAVAFYPMAQAARQALSRIGDGLAWEQVRERILARAGQAQDEETDLLSDLLDDVAASSSPVVYSGRVLAALVVSLGQRAHVYASNLLDTSTPLALDVFTSLALGLTLTGEASRQFSDRLVEYSQRCQQYIAEMDAASRADLSWFARQVVSLCSAEH